MISDVRKVQLRIIFIMLLAVLLIFSVIFREERDGAAVDESRGAEISAVITPPGGKP